MKPIESPQGSDGAFTKLVNTAAGALTATVVAKLLGRPRPAKRRRARCAASAAKRDQRPALAKGGGRHG